MMKQEAAYGNGCGTMSSSVQFGANSEADSLHFNYESTPKPATREKHIVSRYGGQPRITGFPLSSIESFRQSPSNIFSQESGRRSRLTTVPKPTSVKLTQRPYTSSSRTHRSPCFNEAIRCDVLLKSNRLFEQHTIGPLAQVPVSYRRPSTVGSNRPMTQPMNRSVEPVRGQVVLTSLRSQPTLPTNSVRTRAKGELVYNGPSYLLREQAKAIKKEENKNKEEGSSQMEESQFGLTSYFDSIEPESEGADGSSVTSLSFQSGFGNPRIITVPDLVDIYHVEPPPDSKQMREYLIKSRQRTARVNQPDTPGGSSSNGSLGESVATSPIKSKYSNMPRFPIR